MGQWKPVHIQDKHPFFNIRGEGIKKNTEGRIRHVWSTREYGLTVALLWHTYEAGVPHCLFSLANIKKIQWMRKCKRQKISGFGSWSLPSTQERKKKLITASLRHEPIIVSLKMCEWMLAEAIKTGLESFTCLLVLTFICYSSFRPFDLYSDIHINWYVNMEECFWSCSNYLYRASVMCSHTKWTKHHIHLPPISLIHKDELTKIDINQTLLVYKIWLCKHSDHLAFDLSA